MQLTYKKPKVIPNSQSYRQTTPVILYLKQKSGLPQHEIRQKLLKGLTFEIKGQGNELDSRLIQDVLIQNNFYEKATQKQLKDEALRFLKNVVQQWSFIIAKEEKKINREELPNYTAKILAFGSYVLDLRSNSSDIDLVCVVPNFVNRQNHFFQGLASKLQQQVQVKGLTKVRSKKAPIITFDYKQINIDIGFCKLQEQTVPRDIQRVLNMDKINKIKQQQSKNAIMGRKNNLMILQLGNYVSKNLPNISISSPIQISIIIFQYLQTLEIQINANNFD